MTEPIREALQRIVELVHKYRALHALPDTSEWLEAATAAEYALFQTNPIKEWDAVYHAAAQLDPIACCLSELRDRVVALEAAGGVAGNPGYAFAAPAPATADGLSPVEPAPQAQQGVTVEELAYIPSEAPSGDLGAAYWLRKHPRLGPLLRGEGAPAPKRVVLPEAPTKDVWNIPYAGRTFQQVALAVWAAARAEVERQQGGQADG